MKVKLYLAFCGLSLACTASAANILTNGNFGTGDLTGWTVSDVTGFGSFFVDSTDATYYGSPTVGPDGGTYYAVSDDFLPDTVALTQSFTASVADDYTLSFDVFVNDFSEGADLGSSGLGGEVDLLADGSDPILGSPITVFYGPADTATTGGNPNPWVPVSLDITSDLIVGDTYILRVLESDSTATINVGVDNFNLTEIASTPEPGTFLMLVLTAGFFLCARARKARARS